MSDQIIEELIRYAKQSIDDKKIVEKLHSNEVSRIIIHEGEIEDNKAVEGVKIKAKRKSDGFVEVKIIIEKGKKIKEPVYMCFGVLSPDYEQKIDMEITAEDKSEVKMYAFCTFPKSIKVKHIMKTKYKIGKNAKFSYDEFHYHGDIGAKVKSHTEAEVGENSQLTTNFTLIYGTVGSLDYKIKTKLKNESKFAAITRVKSRMNDRVFVEESAKLEGKNAASVLKSRLVATDNSKANFVGEIIGEGNNSRGHVDCKEIIMNNAVAETTPKLKVVNKTSRLTHEAAIGSVDKKELQTLEARGLTKEEAIDLIVKGMME